SLLGQLYERFDLPAVDRHVDQRRSGWEIVVPYVVVRDLVMPDAFAGFEIDADDGVAEQAAAQAVAAVIIVGGRFHRQIGVSELGIDGYRRPDAGVAGVLIGRTLPRLRTELAGLGNRVKRPLLLSSVRIEGHHITGRVPHGVRGETFFEGGR